MPCHEDTRIQMESNGNLRVVREPANEESKEAAIPLSAKVLKPIATIDHILKGNTE